MNYFEIFKSNDFEEHLQMTGFEKRNNWLLVKVVASDLKVYCKRIQCIRITIIGASNI